MIKTIDNAEADQILGPLEPHARAREIAELRGRLEGARITASRSSTPTVIAVLAVGGAITVTADSHDLTGTIILLAATLLAVVLTGLLMREHKSALNQVVYLTKLIALHEQEIRIETSKPLPRQELKIPSSSRPHRHPTHPSPRPAASDEPYTSCSARPDAGYPIDLATHLADRGRLSDPRPAIRTFLAWQTVGLGGCGDGVDAGGVGR